jgi:regulatory protein
MDEILYQKAVEYILRAPKTERQVRDWLFRKRPEGEFLPVDEIITRLKEHGYINDADYAVRFAESKQTKYGMRVIKSKLAVKGVAREHLDEIETPDQTDLARTLATKYMRNKTCDPKTMQKLFRFLLSKGFNYDIISRIAGEFK